jgi:dipeptide/tripeptide permease
LSPQDVPGAAAKPTWRFPSTFWVANSVELFERAAYYGTFIAITLYLTDVVGFGDIWAAWISGLFSASLYLLPFATGTIADRIGFRPALALAFALLSIGYGSLWLAPHKTVVPFTLALIAFGGSFVKSIITGTVAKCSDAASRARAFSLFYMMVNIGSFTGKTVAKPVRVMLGVEFVPLYSSAMALLALAVILFLYWPKAGAEERPKGAARAFRDLATVFSNGRYLALILITAGFWAIQGQLYASLPKYVIRLVGKDASPEWYANVNPFVVVLLVVPVTQLVRKLSPVTSIGISLALISFSPLLMASSGLLQGNVSLLGMSLHPITVMMVLGIAVQGLAECFLSPKYLEFASKQAPPGQEGLYMGYSHMNSFFSYILGFAMSGYLLDAFCPDPKKLGIASPFEMPQAYVHAHYLWYAFAALGVLTLVSLLVFAWITRWMDAKNR